MFFQATKVIDSSGYTNFFPVKLHKFTFFEQLRYEFKHEKTPCLP